MLESFCIGKPSKTDASSNSVGRHFSIFQLWSHSIFSGMIHDTQLLYFYFWFESLYRQLPSEYKMFSFVDKSWKEIMRRVEDRPNALRSAITPGTLDTLQQANASLEKIQKCLEVGGSCCHSFTLPLDVCGVVLMRCLHNNDNHNVFFSVPFLLQSTRPITWNKISEKTTTTTLTLCGRQLALSLSLFFFSLSLSLSPTHTHTLSVGLLKKISFKWWFEGWDDVGWPDFIRESVPDCQRSVRKWPLSKEGFIYIRTASVKCSSLVIRCHFSDGVFLSFCHFS